MPVTTTTTSSYVLATVMADMEEQRIVANLRWFVDGKDCGLIEVIAQGRDFAAILAESPGSGETRGDDVANAIYAFAVAKGIIQGSIA